ncbi:alpha/beta fold hydrolase [Alcanivorax quisquiliarum]|uniref:Alpha/beta fold hydrolase n=1 Tax=Alcanivorax quisquiliarum TaxID=2933565 RepID=A0ABT0E309_9GAMM|nr:alpha/beta fold hydrolase [Alcanivorax quisquiliarum]MCK0536206.1 alpha/beta fold hydrolase [Alcanivorax quisquiliarum]
MKNSSSHELIHSFVETVGQPYLAQSTPPDAEVLAQWRPARSIWNFARRSQVAVSGLKRRHLWLDQHRITYLEGGRHDGEAVVLLHGFGANKENWLFLAGLLASRYRLIIPDLAGFGESHFIASSNYRLATQAERVHRMLGLLKAGPVHIVGNSMGGAIAGIVAARAPEAVLSLTLMNAAGMRGENMSDFEAALMRGENPLIPASLLDVARLFRITTRRNRASLSALLTPILYREMVHRNPVNHRIFRDILHIEEHPEDLFSEIQCPTLIMWGDCDEVLDVSCAASFKQLIPHARTCIFKDVGHLPMLEAPALTARALRTHWREARRQRTH